MFRIGAHVSISDGFEAAVDHEVELGGTCGQIFVGSPRGWAVSEIDETEAEAFRDAADEQDVGPWIVHGTYLINLATPKDDLASKSGLSSTIGSSCTTSARPRPGFRR